MHILVLSAYYLIYCIFIQDSWPEPTQRWSMSARATSKCCMFYPSHPSWESSRAHWSPLGIPEPFPTAWAGSLRTLTEHSVTQSRAREMDADGGTSTRGLWPGHQGCSILCNKKNHLFQCFAPVCSANWAREAGRCKFRLMWIKHYSHCWKALERWPTF